MDVGNRRAAAARRCPELTHQAPDGVFKLGDQDVDRRDVLLFKVRFEPWLDCRQSCFVETAVLPQVVDQRLGRQSFFGPQTIKEPLKL